MVELVGWVSFGLAAIKLVDFAPGADFAGVNLPDNLSSSVFRIN